jgi:AcrR family transcriptional regulator
MARRSEHSQAEIREMILQAAKTIVEEEGVKALKVRRIAMDIGYTVGTIYMVFDSLAEVVLAVKALVLEDLQQALQAACDEVDDPAQAVTISAKAYLSFASQHYHLWSLLFDQHNQYHQELPAWYRQKVDALFANIEQRFSQMTPKASEEDIKQGARTLWSGVHGVCVLSLTGTLDAVGIAHIEQMLNLLVEDFLYGWQHRHKH